jgi:hypothetical protein
MSTQNILMNKRANLQLSSEQRDLVNNTRWILTKHEIIKKVYEMFGEISEMMKKEVLQNTYLFPEDLKHRGGKISKGENYQLLPYVLLDYPSFFVKKNILTVRTMFWWGNFFSITLHLSGYQKTQFISNVPSLLSLLKESNFFICVNHEEWQHHFNEANYVLATSLTETKFNEITRQEFFKIAKKLPLSEWDNAYDFIMEGFKKIVELLQISCQGDKKGLLPAFPTIGSDP